MEVLLKFVNEELEAWTKQGAQEDRVLGDLRGSDHLPEQSKKIIRQVAQYYIKKVQMSGAVFKEKGPNRLQDAYGEAEEKGLRKVSLTDPESHFMKNKKGRVERSYNPQLTADKKRFV